MRSFSLSLLAVTVLLGLGGEREPLDGAQVYKDNCGRCHNPRTPADLSQDGWRAASFHMRVKANLTPREFEALEAFLMPPDLQPFTTQLDNALVRQHCVRCHDGERIEAAIAAGRDKPTWDATLTRMDIYGSTLPAEEADELATWLTEQAP